ncbi:MAG: aspartyl/asparaginyl beta-hydroxylase domain-containing protein [Flavobacteriales bacterium]|nr:aspartyl/asparaginyl beta-hydroxylase domain-containing protein [Flavobacteriales bacterium]
MTEELFYSFVTRDGYKGDAPAYFETSNFEWSKNLESQWLTIKSELDGFLSRGKELWPYFDQQIVSRKNSWKTIPLMAWGVHFRKNEKEAPITSKLLSEIPGLVSASFNMLEGDSEIVPHYGDTDGIMRCHLGLIVPGQLPEIGFKVQQESRSWHEGKLLLFCDAHQHTAWNRTTEKRYILLFDVIRPEYLQKQKQICSKVLASLFLQSISGKLPILRKLPMTAQMILYYMAIPMARISVPIRNTMSRFI